MQGIRRRMRILMAATGIGVITSVLMLIRDGVVLTLEAEILLVFAVPATMFLAVLSIREYKKLKTAELIIENRILHIQPAVIEAGDSSRPLSAGVIEVYISGFGMLLDSTVIKFNLDGVCLKGVEIGRECLCLAYGTNLNTQKARILHGAIEGREMQAIVEKFRFETGIVPIITD